MAKRNTNNVNELRELASLLEHYKWGLEITPFGVNVVKNNSIMDLAFTLEDMKVEEEFVSSVNDLMDQLSQKEFMEMRKTLTWKEIIETLEEELKDMNMVQIIIREWLN